VGYDPSVSRFRGRLQGEKTKNRRAPAELNEAPASLELAGVYI
jgi:hypothetical protein